MFTWNLKVPRPRPGHSPFLGLFSAESLARNIPMNNVLNNRAEGWPQGPC
jgi:hypothetical protein